MYYYIMETAGKKTAVWQEKVKDILGDLGIAGETVAPSPARTIEELAQLGVVKGYNTIVAVGSQKLLNKVASVIINQKENRDIVLGFIPEDYSGSLAKRINTKDTQSACLALKQRRLETIDACMVEPNKFFLTEAILENTTPTDIYLTIDSIKAGLPFNKISIKPGIELNIRDFSIKTKTKNFFSFLFRKKEEEPINDIYSSFFLCENLRIDSEDEILSVKADDDIIAKTPAIFHNRPKALKLIVSRDIISSKNDKNT